MKICLVPSHDSFGFVYYFQSIFPMALVHIIPFGWRGKELLWQNSYCKKIYIYVYHIKIDKIQFFLSHCINDSHVFPVVKKQRNKKPSHLLFFFFLIVILDLKDVIPLCTRSNHIAFQNKQSLAVEDSLYLLVHTENFLTAPILPSPVLPHM